MKTATFFTHFATFLIVATGASAYATTTATDLLEVGSGNTLQVMTLSVAWGEPVPSTSNSAVFAVGQNNTIHGSGSGAIGHLNTVWMSDALAVGKRNTIGASGSIYFEHGSSMAIGQYNYVNGSNLLIVGMSNVTSYDYALESSRGAERSLIVGGWNTSLGIGSIIVGNNNFIDELYEDFPYFWPIENSAVFGNGLISRYDNCLVVGQNNVGNFIPNGQSPPLFVIGNGTSTTARSDAFVVKANGDIIMSKPQGDISMGIYGD